MTGPLLLLTGLVAGLVHALDPDHVVAVTTFVSRSRSPWRAAGYGLWWGVGHALPLLGLGLAVVSLKLTLPPRVEEMAEVAVGVTLVALGAWLIRDVVRQRVHVHAHEHDGTRHVHFHAHRQGPDHRHEHASLAVGAIHGLAGTAAVLVLVPAAMLASPAAAVAYILAFSAGVLVAMAAYGWVAGRAFLALAGRSVVLYRRISAAAACASIALGIVWLARAPWIQHLFA